MVLLAFDEPVRIHRDIAQSLKRGLIGDSASGNNSVFPAAVNIAATWDKAMMHEQGRALGAEFRAKGVHIALTPSVSFNGNSAYSLAH